MKKIKEFFLDLNKLDLKIMKNGLLFSLVVSVFGAFLLLINMIFVHTIILFEIGLAIIKLSLYFSLEFIVCGVIVDKILYNNM